MILSSVQAGQVVLRQIRNAIDAHKVAGGHHKIHLDGALGRAVAVVNVQQTGQHQFAAEHLNGRVFGPFTQARLAETGDVKGVQTLPAAGLSGCLLQQVKIFLVQFQFALGLHITGNVAIGDAPGFGHAGVVGDVQGQARHIHGNVTDGNVKCLAA